MAPTSALAAAVAQTLAAQLAVAAATVATSVPATAAELVLVGVTVATSAPAAVAALAQEAAILVGATLAGAPVVKCPPCSRLSVVRLVRCFAAVPPSLDNFR